MALPPSLILQGQDDLVLNSDVVGRLLCESYDLQSIKSIVTPSHGNKMFLGQSLRLGYIIMTSPPHMLFSFIIFLEQLA